MAGTRAARVAGEMSRDRKIGVASWWPNQLWIFPRRHTQYAVGWQMEVYGSPERILIRYCRNKSYHTIFATHSGRPWLPRWADEGACVTVEHESERSKNHELPLSFLTTNRGIPFNRMFVMKQYPHDIYPLYAQGYSLARFLIMQGGHKRFMEYIGEGMMSERPGREPRNWDDDKKYYGYSDLSELQVRWVHWINKGCPNLGEPNSTALAEKAGSAANSPQFRCPSRRATTKPRSPADELWNFTPAANSGTSSWLPRKLSAMTRSQLRRATRHSQANPTAGRSTTARGQFGRVNRSNSRDNCCPIA